MAVAAACLVAACGGSNKPSVATIEGRVSGGFAAAYSDANQLEWPPGEGDTLVAAPTTTCSQPRNRSYSCTVDWDATDTVNDNTEPYAVTATSDCVTATYIEEDPSTPEEGFVAVVTAWESGNQVANPLHRFEECAGGDFYVPPLPSQPSSTTPAQPSAAPAASTGIHQPGFGGCPSGEDLNDTGYCIPLDDPGPTCAPDEPSAACGPAGRGPTSPASEPAATQVRNSTEPAPAPDAAAIASVVGFARSCQTITEARMDPSWALATFTSPAPSHYCFMHDADGDTVLHRTAGTWHIATQFSDLSGGCPAGVPDDVLRAFALKCPGL